VRAHAVRLCLASLQQTFAESQGLIDGREGVRIHGANPGLSASITIALCTTGDSHLVPELEGCFFNHIRTNVEPPYLGFECHKVLAQRPSAAMIISLIWKTICASPTVCSLRS